MPQLATLPVGHDAATRRQRTSGLPVAALRGHDLTAAERSALLDCYATPDRTFLEIAPCDLIPVKGALSFFEWRKNMLGRQ